MLISRSIWRKLLATLVVVAGFVLLYEATILDSRFGFTRSLSVEPPPRPGTTLLFSATAYCKGTTTASGVNARSGIAAADSDLLPVGSVVQVDAPGQRNDGVYTIMDTGPRVQGRHIDLYMWSCKEALAFGRLGVKIVVLRLGWSPQASTPTMIDRLFRRREAAQQAPTPLPAEAERHIPASALPDSNGSPDDAPATPATGEQAAESAQDAAAAPPDGSAPVTQPGVPAPKPEH